MQRFEERKDAKASLCVRFYSYWRRTPVLCLVVANREWAMGE